MSFEEMMKSLQREYLSSIPEKIKVIEGQILTSDTSNLRESFHKLKGTGRTYGLPEVSELGAIVELICIEHPVNSVKAGEIAAAILRDVYKTRSAGAVFEFAQDARVSDLQKLLPK
ncbi:MAG: Hpt domain-containing protein [Bdellovibrionales bacterium]